MSTSGTNALSSYTYEFDPASNVKKVTEAYGNTALNRTVTNSYDEANRLTQEVTTGSAALTTDFEYDKANNRTKMTKGSVVTNYTYNDLNQLTEVSDGTTAHQRDFYYDLNGRRWYEFHGGTLTLPTDYFYNFENQLIGSKIESTGYLYNFTYDYRSRRVRKQIYTYTVPDPSSGLTNLFNNYVFSGGVEVRVLESTVPHEQNPSVDYVRGSDWGGGVGGILYSLRSGVPSFTHYNRRGDVTSKVSLSGSTTYQATYEAYGLRVTETGSTLDPQKSNTKDEDIPGYANEGMRFRDLSTGVFITPDPAGFVDGPNLYAYVKQNPWTSFDPEGLHVDIKHSVRKNPDGTSTKVTDITVTGKVDFQGQSAKLDRKKQQALVDRIEKGIKKTFENVKGGGEVNVSVDLKIADNGENKITKNDNVFRFEDHLGSAKGGVVPPGSYTGGLTVPGYNLTRLSFELTKARGDEVGLQAAHEFGHQLGLLHAAKTDRFNSAEESSNPEKFYLVDKNPVEVPQGNVMRYNKHQGEAVSAGQIDSLSNSKTNHDDPRKYEAPN